MKKQKGQVVVAVLFLVPALLIVIYFTLALGNLVYLRIKLQNATDSAAFTAAVWQARGLNLVSDLNWALLAAAGGDIAKLLVLKPDFALIKGVQDSQTAVQRSFSGVSAMAMRKNFKENIGGAMPLEMVLGIPDASMYSLRVRRKIILGKFPLYLEKDEPVYWTAQNKTGPFIRICGIKEGSTNWLFFKTPQMLAVAQARPALANDKYEGSCYLGGLWDPSFYAKLTPVSVKLPFAEGLIVH